jgi:hypothetical protein
MVQLRGQLEAAGRLDGHPVQLAAQPGVLGPGRGHRADPLQLTGAEGAAGRLLQRRLGLRVAAAGLQPAQGDQRGHDADPRLLPLPEHVPGVPLGTGPVALAQRHLGPDAGQVLGVAGEIPVDGEPQRPIQCRPAPPVVAELERRVGEIHQRPRGVVRQVLPQREVERLLQLRPAGVVADVQAGRGDVGQRVRQRLLVAHLPGQRDRPRPRASRPPRRCGTPR